MAYDDAPDPYDAYPDAPQVQAAPVAAQAPDPYDAYPDAPQAQPPPQAAPVAASPPATTQPDDSGIPPPPDLPPELGGGPAKAAAPQDTRPTSQALGFGEQAAKRVSALSDRLENNPTLKPWLDALDAAVPGVDAVRRIVGSQGLLQTKVMPWLQQQEQHFRPGGIGKVGADLAVGGAAMAAAPESIGLLGAGALGGAALSDAPANDTKGLLRDTAIGAVTNRIGAPIIDKALGVVGDLGASALTKAVNPATLVAGVRAAKKSAYDYMKSLDVTYSPGAVAKLHQQLTDAFNDFAPRRSQSGNASDLIGDIEDKAANGVSMGLKEVEDFRSDLGDQMKQGSDTAKALAMRLHQTVSDFMNNATGADLMGPNASDALAQKGAQAARDARSANMNFKNANLIDTKLASASNKAARTYQGLNLDNKVRQTLGPLVDEGDPRNILKFLSPEETSRLKGIVYGTVPQNLMRAAGSFLSPGKLIGMALAGEGAAMTHVVNPTMAALAPAAAVIGKFGSNAVTKAKVGQLIDLMSSGGTNEKLLAARQLRAEALKNSNVGQWVKAAGLDLGEAGRTAAVRGTVGEANARAAQSNPQQSRSRFGYAGP